MNARYYALNSQKGPRRDVTVTGGSSRRVSLATLITVTDGQQPRLIYRAHTGSRRSDKRMGLTEQDYAWLLGAAHQQPGGPLVLIWDNLSTMSAGR